MMEDGPLVEFAGKAVYSEELTIFYFEQWKVGLFTFYF